MLVGCKSPEEVVEALAVAGALGAEALEAVAGVLAVAGALGAEALEAVAGGFLGVVAVLDGGSA